MLQSLTMKNFVECCEISLYEPLQKWSISVKQVSETVEQENLTDWKVRHCHTMQIKLKSKNNNFCRNATLLFSLPCEKKLSQIRGTDSELKAVEE